MVSDGVKRINVYAPCRWQQHADRRRREVFVHFRFHPVPPLHHGAPVGDVIFFNRYGIVEGAYEGAATELSFSVELHRGSLPCGIRCKQGE